MVTLLDSISGILLAGGSFFILCGGIGLIRLPDFYARMHVAGVTDTLGAGRFIAGLMIQGGLSLITVKLLLILVFYFFASPTSSYALANAALSQGEKPWTRNNQADIGKGDTASNT